MGGWMKAGAEAESGVEGREGGGEARGLAAVFVRDDVDTVARMEAELAGSPTSLGDREPASGLAAGRNGGDEEAAPFTSAAFVLCCAAKKPDASSLRSMIGPASQDGRGTSLM